MKSEWKRSERLRRNENQEQEEKITERGQVKGEGKSIYYAIRFHARRHSIPSSVQLTIPLFRRNSPHSPWRMKGEGRWGKGIFIPPQIPLLFFRFLHQITTFWVSEEKLGGVKGILVLELSRPQPQGLSMQAPMIPLGEEAPVSFLGFLSCLSAQQLHISLLKYHLTASTLSNHYQLPVDHLLFCSSSNSMRTSLQRLSYPVHSSCPWRPAGRLTNLRRGSPASQEFFFFIF